VGSAGVGAGGSPGPAPEDPAETGDHEPDPRLRYANERTFLAWIRTSLALVATGLGITQLLPAFRVAGGRRVVGLPLIALGTWVAAAAFRRWEANEGAMRAGRPLPPSRMFVTIAVVVSVVAAVALVLAALGNPNS